jgi:hypothetical protein
MKVLVAGATGALGRQLVPELAARGHEVFGMTRSDSKRELLRSMGATPVVADALDPDARAKAVAESDPEVIVSPAHRPLELDRHAPLRPRPRADHPPEDRRHRPPAGGGARDRREALRGPELRRPALRAERLDTAPPHGMRCGLEAIRYLEAAVTGAEWTTGIVLRYGGFYGPGTSIAPEEEHFELIRKRRFPVVGDGGGVWSFHTHRGCRGRDGGGRGAWVPRDLQRRRR